MVFASIVFLFLFLPAVLGLHFLLPRKLRNPFLVLASLIFYAWGEASYVLLMLASITANILLGVCLGRTRAGPFGKAVLALAVTVNLGFLAAFKYANFLAENLNVILVAFGFWVRLSPVHLPIGISFFTFQAMSYVIDVYRRQADVQRNPLNVALYISLFPQLIAGPIVRYQHIAGQLIARVITREDFAYGIRRFIVGLGKKVLIANVVAVPADQIFAIPPTHLTTGLAWLGVISYTIQIYFDFSGYSDMAIGLGRMLGFRFLENFNYPYVSASIREFWRRWHISLSTWFRDYLYISLGGNRRAPGRVYFNLVTVFFLCGLWHGASWTFVIWGLYHGLFLASERTGFGDKLNSLWTPLRHVYAILAVVVGWVLFRSDDLSQAITFLAAMAGFAPGAGVRHHAALYLSWEVALALVIGCVGSLPIAPKLSQWLARVVTSRPGSAYRVLDGVLTSAGVLALLAVLVASAMWLSAGTYNPFIYFRF